MKKILLATLAIIILLVLAGATLIWFDPRNNPESNPNNTPSNPSKTLHSLAPTIWSMLQQNSLDTRVTDRTAFLDATFQDFLNWGVYGDATVLNPGSDTYRTEPLTAQTIQFFWNYSFALHQLGLPSHNLTDIYAVGNMTQNNPEIVNFESIRYGDDSSDIYIVPNPPRECWSIVQQVKDIRAGGYELLNHPEANLGVCTKVITNNWCLFGAPTGIKMYDSDITPNDARVSDLTSTQWKLFSQFAPMDGVVKTYSDFAWWDSHKLRANNSDEDSLRTSMFNFWQLSPGTYSINGQKFVSGIEGAKTDLLQSAAEFRTIVSLYPNGQVQTPYIGLQDPRSDYYGEMADRAAHGMKNTIDSFLGSRDDSILLTTQGTQGLPDWAKSQNGLDNFITKNWPSFDLVKFIEGYERMNTKVPETIGLSYITPSVLRMAGFPVNCIAINPTPYMASPGEYAVGLPQSVAHNLQASFPDVLLGPGYTVSIYSCKDGLKADGIKQVVVTLPIGSERVYLMKDGQ